MPRRKQKLSRRKSRTMWLAWIAWGVFGAIIQFEDTQGGSGTLSLILTSPFWLAFAVWPFLWLWIRTRKDPTMVDFDDDVSVDGKTARLIIKDGKRYAQAESFAEIFGVKTAGTVKLAGGDEDFVCLEDVRDQAKGNEALEKWFATVDQIDPLN